MAARKRTYIGVALLVAFASGCATTRHAVPAAMLASASVSGMRDIRAFAGSPSSPFIQDFIRLFAQEEKKNFPYFETQQKVYPMLAISGGAADGAYGAGLLNGWTVNGSRPEFKVVTGISTGAIIAPLAFLGSEYDGKLKEFFTKYSTRDIFRRRFFPGNSFGSSRPLEQLIERNFDAALLARIAEEYREGRRLYVGTTNLDAQRLVVWDMGRIAAQGGEESLALFRKIILASASVPVAVPPVYLKVRVGDRTYDEMHVDGGITSQVFFLYDVMQGFEEAAKERQIDLDRIKYRIFVIRNGYAEAVWKEVEDSVFSIADRAVATMVNYQGVGDLYKLYAFSQRGKGEFNLAYIPASFKQKQKELFDPQEMRELFELGFQEAARGYPWRKTPPGLGGE